MQDQRKNTVNTPLSLSKVSITNYSDILPIPNEQYRKHIKLMVIIAENLSTSRISNIRLIQDVDMKFKL